MLAATKLMETDYKTFYSGYLKEFHQVKAIYLKNLLNSIPEIKEKLEEYEYGIELTKNTKFIVQADLRQNYFHAIESFFELFFALLPDNDKIPDNRHIVRRLSKSNWRSNYKKIEQIAEGKLKLDPLFERQVTFNDHEVSVGQYMFYLGVFSKEKYSPELFKDMKLSLNAIKEGIKAVAIDFSKRDEYNAYKHAIRIFPSFKSLHFVNVKDMKKAVKLDLSNSVSYQVYDDVNKKVSVKTKVFDSERDFQMTSFCSNLIHNIVYFRDLVFGDMSRKGKDEMIAIRMFDLDALNKCRECNVGIQDLVFSTQQRIDKGSS